MRLLSLIVLALSWLALPAHAADRHITLTTTQAFESGRPLELGTIMAKHDNPHMRIFLTLKNDTGLPVSLGTPQPSCGCTVVHLQGEVLLPGEAREMEIDMNLEGKRGKIVKTIRFEPGTLILQGTLAGDDTLGDPDVIFKEADCRKCHFDPAEGKTGQPLYEAVCQACHPYGVPLPNRDIIAKGLPHTSMTGWSQALGGPLSDAQIESLMGYMRSQVKEPEEN